MTTPFWQAVRELAAMRDRIPCERRDMSAVREWLRLELLRKEKS